MNNLLSLLLALLTLVLCGCTAPTVSTQPPETTSAVLVIQTEPPETVPPTTEPLETTCPTPAWEILQTPESSCFTVISYCPDISLLRVQFRESEAWYIYYDVELELWQDFKNADSKGRFFNQSIKGFYEYDRE